jgi:DNA ligase 1
MLAFTSLYAALDETTKTTRKVAALVEYFQAAAPEDAAWAIYFLSGRKPKQVVPTKKLRAWAAEAAQVPDWLFEECYHAVGDLAETIALIHPDGEPATPLPLHFWVEHRLLPLRNMPEQEQYARVMQYWLELSPSERFVWNKLITGAFRVGVSQLLVTRALAQVAKLTASVISHRLMGTWEPTPAFYAQLTAPMAEEHAATPHGGDISRPYPFCLAHPLEAEPETLGEIANWQVEWKWDGIRSQLIRRAGESFLWSRGEELVTDRYPEIAGVADALPDGTVIDGEILPWNAETGVQPFALLQKRIGRKKLTKPILAEVPVTLLAYDLLEWQGQDIREWPMAKRRAQLEQVIAGVPGFAISELIHVESWQNLAELRRESRARKVEGMMLKASQSSYRTGRVRGDWWKWKVEPFSVDAVLVYAQRGSGKRASLYTDYTFAVWQGENLVPFAKAYSGLTDAEIRQVDAYVKANTIEKFGPVRTVKPGLVFEIAFEGIQASTRHKSGVAVRFPRIARWRTDKPMAEADTLANVKALAALSVEFPADSEAEPV